MEQFETTIHLLAKYLPKEYMASINKDDPHPLGPEDEVPDVEVIVTFNPGVYYPGNRSGHPDTWEDDSGDPPEIDKVELLGDGFVDITSNIPNAIFQHLIEECWEAQKQIETNRLYDAADAKLSFMDGEY